MVDVQVMSSSSRSRNGRFDVEHRGTTSEVKKVAGTVGPQTTEDTCPEPWTAWNMAYDALHGHFTATIYPDETTEERDTHAAHQVLSNPELVEMIIAALPPATVRNPHSFERLGGKTRQPTSTHFDHGAQIWRCRRVNRFFRDLIDTSPLLRKMTFQQPRWKSGPFPRFPWTKIEIKTLGAEDTSLQAPFVVNPLLHLPTIGFSTKPRDGSEPRENYGFRFACTPKCVDACGEDFMKMFGGMQLSQPPIRVLTACRRSRTETFEVIERDQGITLGDVVSMAKRHIPNQKRGLGVWFYAPNKFWEDA